MWANHQYFVESWVNEKGRFVKKVMIVFDKCNFRGT